MDINIFFKKYNGKGVDFDGSFGDQCVDLYQQYNKDVVGGNIVHGNAVDFWTAYPTAFYTQIGNTPNNVPQEGDVMIWGTKVGQYGHIAIYHKGDVNIFESFDQNWPVGSTCHFQSHSYNGVLGWLRPKPQVIDIPPVFPVVTDQTKLTTNDDGELTWGSIKSILSDRKRDYTALQAKVDGYLTTIGDNSRQIGQLQTDLTECQTHTTTTTTLPIKYIPEASKVPTFIRKFFGDSL